MKPKIRLITLILSALLMLSFVSLLASCDNITYKLRTDPDKIEDKTGKLTDEMKSEIQLEYYRIRRMLYISPKNVEGVCYGVFDDAYCLIIRHPEPSATVMTYEEVAGYEFSFGSEHITVYCNGEIYSLTKAYENGILNDAEIEELWNFYTGPKLNNMNTDPDQIIDKTGKLTDAIKSEIQIKYYERHIYSNGSPAQIRGICYGVFGDAYCLMLTSPGVEYTTAMVYIDVAGYTFEFGSSNTMIVYYNGEFYGLKKAYENGILNDAEVEELYNFYTETEWGN